MDTLFPFSFNIPDDMFRSIINGRNSLIYFNFNKLYFLQISCDDNSFTYKCVPTKECKMTGEEMLGFILSNEKLREYIGILTNKIIISIKAYMNIEKDNKSKNTVAVYLRCEFMSLKELMIHISDVTESDPTEKEDIQKGFFPIALKDKKLPCYVELYQLRDENINKPIVNQLYYCKISISESNMIFKINKNNIDNYKDDLYEILEKYLKIKIHSYLKEYYNIDINLKLEVDTVVTSSSDSYINLMCLIKIIGLNDMLIHSMQYGNINFIVPYGEDPNHYLENHTGYEGIFENIPFIMNLICPLILVFPYDSAQLLLAGKEITYTKDSLEQILMTNYNLIYIYIDENSEETEKEYSILNTMTNGSLTKYKELDKLASGKLLKFINYPSFDIKNPRNNFYKLDSNNNSLAPTYLASILFKNDMILDSDYCENLLKYLKNNSNKYDIKIMNMTNFGVMLGFYNKQH